MEGEAAHLSRAASPSPGPSPAGIRPPAARAAEEPRCGLHLRAQDPQDKPADTAGGTLRPPDAPARCQASRWPMWAESLGEWARSPPHNPMAVAKGVCTEAGGEERHTASPGPSDETQETAGRAVTLKANTAPGLQEETGRGGDRFPCACACWPRSPPLSRAANPQVLLKDV